MLSENKIWRRHASVRNGVVQTSHYNNLGAVNLYKYLVITSFSAE